MLVLKHAIEHEKFLAAAMRVRREATGRRVADNRGRPGHLVPNPVEHAPFDPGDW